MKKQVSSILEDIEPYAHDDSGLHIPQPQIEKATEKIMSLMEEAIAKDDYAALEAKLADRVKVKQLEWTELSTGWIAHTSFHAYEVVKTDHGFMATYANRDFAWGAEDAMKAAAQADFDRRILSALESTPPAPPGWSRVTEDDGAKYLNPPDGWLNTELTTPPAPKVTADTIYELRWIMQNLPVEFAMHERCPTDTLMHVITTLTAAQEAGKQ